MSNTPGRTATVRSLCIEAAIITSLSFLINGQSVYLVKRGSNCRCAEIAYRISRRVGDTYAIEDVDGTPFHAYITDEAVWLQ